MPTVLFEDEFCMIVNKPSNMLVHHSKYAENKKDELSICQWINESFSWSPFLAHRLDYKTSGIILVAKSPIVAQVFQELFEKQQIVKIYHALLRGHTADRGIIDSPVKNERANYKDALTDYQTLERYVLSIPVEPYPESRYSLVAMSPKTGRTNQLRIHANKFKHPIIGDPKFGNRHHNHMFQDQLHIPFLFLHAHQLNFIHPFTQENMQIEAQKPTFWNHFFTNPLLRSI